MTSRPKVVVVLGSQRCPSLLASAVHPLCPKATLTNHLQEGQGAHRSLAMRHNAHFQECDRSARIGRGGTVWVTGDLGQRAAGC